MTLDALNLIVQILGVLLVSGSLIFVGQHTRWTAMVGGTSKLWNAELANYLSARLEAEAASLPRWTDFLPHMLAPSGAPATGPRA